jgi:tight adherence protein C
MGIALTIAAWVFVGVGSFAVGWSLSATPPTVAASLGLRGLKRQRALDDNVLFALVDPFVRLFAPLFVATPGPILDHVERTLQHAGDYLGLSREELLSLSAISGVTAGAAGFAFARYVGLPDILFLFATGLGLVTPWVVVTGEVGVRQREIDRALPAAIDLVALCMGAGLDFRTAVRRVVDHSRRRRDPLAEELGYVLRRMSLGATRRAALSTLAVRVPTETVKSFVSSVVQSEIKGTPLVETLKTQAKTLRSRRTLAGEEAASRAAVLMMIPLMLILCAIILVLMGPFLLAGMGSGF